MGIVAYPLGALVGRELKRTRPLYRETWLPSSQVSAERPIFRWPDDDALAHKLAGRVPLAWERMKISTLPPDERSPRVDGRWQRGHAPPMAIPRGIWKIVKEILRHLLRRPVVGVAAAARTSDGRWLLIRRTDTGEWALPGGTVEWGETVRTTIVRELAEEAGVLNVKLGGLLGVYSAPERDARFHAVTIIVAATVAEPEREPDNPMEISEVRLFADDEMPENLAHGMLEMLTRARAGVSHWE